MKKISQALIKRVGAKLEALKLRVIVHQTGKSLAILSYLLKQLIRK